MVNIVVFFIHPEKKFNYFIYDATLLRIYNLTTYYKQLKGKINKTKT